MSSCHLSHFQENSALLVQLKVMTWRPSQSKLMTSSSANIGDGSNKPFSENVLGHTTGLKYGRPLISLDIDKMALVSISDSSAQMVLRLK